MKVFVLAALLAPLFAQDLFERRNAALDAYEDAMADALAARDLVDHYDQLARRREKPGCKGHCSSTYISVSGPGIRERACSHCHGVCPHVAILK